MNVGRNAVVPVSGSRSATIRQPAWVHGVELDAVVAVDLQVDEAGDQDAVVEVLVRRSGAVHPRPPR